MEICRTRSWLGHSWCCALAASAEAARRHSSVLILSLALLGGALLGGCTPSDRSEASKSPEVPGAKAAGAAASGDPAAAKEASPPKAPATQAERQLLDKIQPPGLKATEKPSPKPAEANLVVGPPVDAKAALEGAEALVRRFADAIQKGDSAAAEALLFSAKDFESEVSPGYRDILGGSIPAQNKKVVESLVKAAKDREMKLTWKPGSAASVAPRNVFTEAQVSVNDSILGWNAGGVPFEVRFEQIVQLKSGWKIFRVNLP